MAAPKEIFISSDPQETRVAITENKRLEEFYVERSSDQRMVGSIYKGRVTSIVPGIGAAFVDIGLGKNGFLYVSDIVEPSPKRTRCWKASLHSRSARHRRTRAAPGSKRSSSRTRKSWSRS